MIFIGVDPGSSGGIAVLYNGKSAGLDHGRILLKKNKVEDESELLEFLHNVIYEDKGIPIVLCLEMITATGGTQGNGVISNFKLGYSYGWFCGVFEVLRTFDNRITFLQATPQKWQNHFGLIRRRKKGEPKLPKLTQTEKKNRNKDKAIELFPDVKVTHAYADALLIAKWAVDQIYGE